MSPEIYRVLHVVGALLLFLSLGGVLLVPGDQKASKLVMPLHGIALLIMVVAGVGVVHKDDTVSWQPWLYAKIGCWLFVAVLPVLVRKGTISRFVGLLLAIAAGATAVWLAQMKPF